VLAQAALSRIGEQRLWVTEQRPDTAGEWASRAERLAQLWELEARWMRVLCRWVWRQRAVPAVLGDAAFAAAEFQSERAEFWRGIAVDWRRRAAGQPVCAVIGCGCGGECGVAA
jgi:hypothetical protein